jgi:hypothetical protein
VWALGLDGVPYIAPWFPRDLPFWVVENRILEWEASRLEVRDCMDRIRGRKRLLMFQSGGISYFGATYGFGCDMVSNFEIVLADGSIKNANAQQNPALFTALKGGSNNFGIVTRFDMKTFALGQYFGGSDYYLGAETPQLIDAFAAFTANPKFDIKAAAFLSILYTAQEGFISLVTFSYTEAISNPPVFANFTAVPPILSTTGISTLDVFAEELGGANTPDNLR